MSKIKIGSFLLSLLKKAGVDVDSTKPEFADLLSANLEIPSEMAKQINEGLMNFDAAIENDAVGERIRASALGTIDKDLLKLVDKFELPDLKEKFKNERSTRTKLNWLMDEIETAGKKKGVKSTDDKDKEIETLNTKLRELNETNTAAVTLKDSTHANELIDAKLDVLLSSYTYADLPGGKDFTISFAKQALKKDIADKKGKLVLENGTIKIAKAEGTGELYDDQHNKIELKGLVDGTLSANKLLVVTDPKPPKTDTIEVPGGGGAGNLGAAQALTTLADSLTNKQG